MKNLDKKFTKIAISGGCGFVGSEFINYLNNQGYTNIDIFEKLDGLHNKWQNVAGLVFNNILDYNMLLREDITNNYDWLVLNGANSSTKTSKDEYQQTLYDNVEYPIKVIDNIIYNNDCTNVKKLIFSSSAATYGLSNNFKERITDIKPTNFYGLTKLMVDRYLDKIYGKYRVFSEGNVLPSYCRFYSFRYFNVFGQNESHKAEANMTSPVSRFLGQKPPFILYNSANPEILTDQMSRDFIAIKDVCATMFWALTNSPDEGLYNLGSGIATTWKELLQIVCELKGYKFEDVVKYQDMPEEIRSHYQYITKSDISKLRAAGYSAEMTNIKDAIKELIKE